MKAHAASTAHPAARPHAACALALLYGALIVQAALSHGGRLWLPDWEQASWARAFAWPRTLPRVDLVINLLGYLPFGYLLARSLVALAHGLSRHGARACPSGMGFAVGIALAATALATGASALTEWLQTAIPGRVSSIVDVAANAAGALAGALARPVFHQLFDPDGRWGGPVRRLVAPGALPRLALAMLAAWLADRLWPLGLQLYAPQFAARAFAALGSLGEAAAGPPGRAHGVTAAVPVLAEGFRLFALHAPALLAATAIGTSARARRGLPVLLFAAASAAMLVGAAHDPRLAQPARWIAPAVALALALATAGEHAHRARRVAWVAAVAAATAGLAIDGLTPSASGAAALPSGFNWTPFARTLTRQDLGLVTFLGLAAQLGPPAYLVCRLVRPGAGLALAGAAATAALVLAIEWGQRWVPGRHGDATMALVAACLWLACVRLAMADRDDRARRRGA